MSSEFRKVFVVSFQPSCEELGSVGGFWWYFTYADAEVEYVEQVKNSSHWGGSHIIRLVTFTVPTDWTQDEITAHLDTELEFLEITAPPVRQYIPSATDPDRLPTGVGRRTLTRHI